MPDVRDTPKPHAAARAYWTTWLVVTLVLTALYVMTRQWPGLAWMIGDEVQTGMLVALATFAVPEGYGYFRAPDWTLSRYIWRWPWWARWISAMWLGGMAGVTLHPYLGDAAAFVGVFTTVWLGAHFVGRGRTL